LVPKFEREDIKAIAELELACERLAMQAQHKAALLKKARERADILMKTARAIERSALRVVGSEDCA